MELSPENIEKALAQFYSDDSNKRTIHQWLNAAQVSQTAWSFSWQLLDANKPSEVQFFGANCLHTKISRFWNELEEKQYESLKTQLLDCLLRLAKGPRIVITRLCVTLAALILQMTPQHWPAAVPDIIAMFQSDIPNLNPTERCKLLLDILTVLPEEFLTCHITKHRRGHLRDELHQSMTHLIPLLKSLMGKDCPPEIHEKALICTSSWVRFGIPLADGEELILLVFQAMFVEQLFDKASEVLVEVFQHPEANRYPSCMKKLLGSVVQLQPLIDQANQQQDMDVVQALCQVIAAASECNTKIILDCLLSELSEERNIAINLVSLVLKCTNLSGNYPVDENSSHLMFTFWYTFQDDIVSCSDDHIRYNRYKQFACPVYVQVVHILSQKVQYPDESVYEDMSADEKEMFRCYRQDISDTMMNCYGLLNDAILVQLYAALNDAATSSKPLRWQEVEATLFLLTAVSESVSLEEEIYLPKIFQILPRIPFTTTNMISTALFLIGGYAEWIKYHPEVLGCVLPLLLQGIGNKEVAMAASMALKDITRENQQHLKLFVGQIFDTIQVVIHSGKLKSQECIRLMCSVGHILSVLPLGVILEKLNSLLSPSIEQLRILAKQEHSIAAKSAILVRINMFTWLFASLDTKPDDEEVSKPSAEQQPVAIILQQITDVVEGIITGWISDAGVVDAICDLYKKALRTLMDDMSPLLPLLCQMLTLMFTAVPHTAILDLSKQLIIMFDGGESKAITTQLFLSLSNKCIECSKTGGQENTDIVEGFMVLLSQLLKKRSHVFDESACDLLGMFSVGLIGMSLPEIPTVKASCTFMIEFLNKLGSKEGLMQIVNNLGHNVIDRILRSVGGESSRQVVDNMADVLSAICQYNTSDVSTWLRTYVSQENYPSFRVNTKQKEDYVKSILRHFNNRRKVRELTKEFSLTCRGLIATEYGATT